MDVSGIGGSPMTGAVNNRLGSAGAMDGVSERDITQSVNKAVEDMKQDEDLKQFQIFVPSGQMPEDQRYQEDWMRPMENFML